MTDQVSAEIARIESERNRNEAERLKFVRCLPAWSDQVNYLILQNISAKIKLI